VLVLALDTSSIATTVAVADVARSEVAPNRHAEVLVPLIDRALRDAGVTRTGIQSICVGVGPGPFTGLRVGIVTALTLGDALGVDVHGVCSLDAIAHIDGRPWGDGFTVVTDARRKEVYWATYRDGRRLSGPSVDRPGDVAARLAPGSTLVGAGAVLYRETFEGFSIDDRAPYPAAAALAGLAAEPAWRVPVEPMYLRRPHAQPTGPPKRVLPA